MPISKISIHIGPTDAFDPQDERFSQYAAKFADFAGARGYDTRLISGHAATWSAVLAAVEAAAADLAPDGECLLTYCGHGLRQIDGCSVDDTQAWMLRDRMPTEMVFRHVLMSKFQATHRVVVVNDSCYSGNWANLQRIGSILRRLSEKAGHDFATDKKLQDELAQILVDHFYGASIASIRRVLEAEVFDFCAEGGPPSCRLMVLAASRAGATAIKARFSAVLLDLMQSKPAPTSYQGLIAAARTKLDGVQDPELNSDFIEMGDLRPF